MVIKIPTRVHREKSWVVVPRLLPVSHSALYACWLALGSLRVVLNAISHWHCVSGYDKKIHQKAPNTFWGRENHAETSRKILIIIRLEQPGRS